MKSLLLIAVFGLFPGVAHSGSYLEDATKLLSSKIKETMPIGIFGINQKPSASLYLPIWRFHANLDANIEYFNFGVGGEWNEEIRGGEAYAGGMFNLVSLSGKFWDFNWAERHVKRSKFPPLYIGPSLLLPFDAKQIKETFSSWDKFLDRGRLMVGVKF